MPAQSDQAPVPEAEPPPEASLVSIGGSEPMPSAEGESEPEPHGPVGFEPEFEQLDEPDLVAANESPLEDEASPADDALSEVEPEPENDGEPEPRSSRG